MKFIPLAALAALAALAPAFAPAPARADTAILVGVNKYSNLPARNQLEGCVNDAQSMQSSLKAYGFTNIIVLTDAQATHDAVLKAIKNSANKPSERFVFGFFGHGTNDGGRKAVILPSDATMSGGNADIDADTLRAAIANVPASSRTIILDSCFSGGMLRSVKSLKPGIRSRFVERPNAKLNFNPNRTRGDAKDLTRDDSAPGPNPGPSGGSAPCYVVAAAQNQPACEDVFEGVKHGVFTATLTKQLGQSGTKSKTWGEVITDVRATMDDLLEGTQKPEVSPSFASVKVFGDKGADPKPYKPDNLWDVYNTDQRDANAISVSVSPEITSIPIGVHIDLAAKVGKITSESYLVVIEKGTSGNINLLFPRTPDLDESAIDENKTIALGGYRADQKGSEVVRGILFRSKDAARLLLDAFKGGGTQNEGAYKLTRSAFRSALLKRDLRADTPLSDFSTADLTFEVVGAK